MKNRHKARWEPNEVARLRELAAQSKSDKQIGRELGRTKLSIRTKRRTLKVRPGWKPIAVTSAVKRMLGRLNDQQAATKLGCSDSAVHRLRKKLGIKAATAHSREWSKAELAKLGTMPDSELADLLGVSRKHVFEQRKRRGIKPFKSKPA